MDIIYGKNTVEAYLKNADNKGFKLWLLKNQASQDFFSLAKKQGIPFEFTNKRKLDELSEGNHQGVVLEIEAIEYVSLDKIMNKKDKNLIVVCDQLEDPHNLGAILRTCDAVGVDGVIIGKHRSVGLSSTVAKVSTGAMSVVDVHQATNIVNALKELKDNGYWVVAAENAIDAQSYDEFPVDMPIVLVLGSEGRGISRLVLESADIKTTIPMTGTVNSLNVSVAAGIMLFEINRRR